jgi:hypothetical protein
METELNSTQQAESTRPVQPANLGRCLVAAITAGLLVCAVLFAFYPFASLEFPELGISPKPEDVAKFQSAHYGFWPTNHALAYGFIGLVSGISWGLIASTKFRIFTATIAGISSMFGGALAGYATGPFYAKAAIESADRSLVESAIFHSAVWIAVLVPIFFSIGYAQGTLQKAMNFAISGIVTGASVAICYLLCASFIAPGENLTSLVPSSNPAKVVWFLVMVLVVGMGGVLAMRPATTPSMK